MLSEGREQEELQSSRKFRKRFVRRCEERHGRVALDLPFPVLAAGMLFKSVLKEVREVHTTQGRCLRRSSANSVTYITEVTFQCAKVFREEEKGFKYAQRRVQRMIDDMNNP